MTACLFTATRIRSFSDPRNCTHPLADHFLGRRISKSARDCAMLAASLSAAARIAACFRSCDIAGVMELLKQQCNDFRNVSQRFIAAHGCVSVARPR